MRGMQGIHHHACTILSNGQYAVPISLYIVIYCIAIPACRILNTNAPTTTVKTSMLMEIFRTVILAQHQ